MDSVMVKAMVLASASASAFGSLNAEPALQLIPFVPCVD